MCHPWPSSQTAAMWQSKKRPHLNQFVFIRLVVFKHICQTGEKHAFTPIDFFCPTPPLLQSDFLDALLEFLSIPFVKSLFSL